MQPQNPQFEPKDRKIENLQPKNPSEAIYLLLKYIAAGRNELMDRRINGTISIKIDELENSYKNIWVLATKCKDAIDAESKPAPIHPDSMSISKATNCSEDWTI